MQLRWISVLTCFSCGLGLLGVSYMHLLSELHQYRLAAVYQFTFRSIHPVFGSLYGFNSGQSGTIFLTILSVNLRLYILFSHTYDLQYWIPTRLLQQHVPGDVISVRPFSITAGSQANCDLAPDLPHEGLKPGYTWSVWQDFSFPSECSFLHGLRSLIYRG